MSEQLSFDDFKRDWLSRHNGSRIPRPRISSWGLMAGIFLWAVIAIGAALVSGAHSVPAILQTIPPVVPSPYREVLSLFGFTIFELLIFAGAVYRKEIRVAGWSLGLAMIGALMANIGSSVYAVTVNGGDLFNYVVAIILAFIAPLAAGLAGEMVNVLYSKHHETITLAMDEYAIKLKELDITINREFTKYQKSFIVQVEKVVPVLNSVNEFTEQPALAVHSVNHSVNSANGYTKLMNSRLVIREFFEQHPERVQGRLDDLVNEIERETGMKVGRTSIHNVRSEMVTVSSNGNQET